MAICCGNIPLHRPHIGLICMVGTANQPVPELVIEALGQPWFSNIRCNAEADPSRNARVPGVPACKGPVAVGPAEREIEA